jgi:hypothetical protein
MQVLTETYTLIDVFTKVFWWLTGIHFLLGLIFFLIRYKDRMTYLRKNKLTRLSGWTSEAFHFIVIFSICMVVGSFLLVQSTLRYFRFMNAFTVSSLKKSREKENRVKNQ